MVADFRLDPGNEVHARALERLRTEQIGWLGSTGRDGFPHAVPIWFLWHDETVVVFSQPKAAKTRNLRADPRAMLHLEAGEDGEQLQVLQGTAEISDLSTTQWLAQHGDVYVAKYSDGLGRLGWTMQRMADDFSVVIVIRPHKLIAW